MPLPARRLATVRLDLAFEVVAELLGDLAFDLATAEKSTKRGDETSDHPRAPRMRRIDSANASHVSVSFVQALPAGRVIV